MNEIYSCYLCELLNNRINILTSLFPKYPIHSLPDLFFVCDSVVVLVNSLRRVSDLLGDLEGMIPLVDHFGDETAPGRTPVNLLPDAQVVADLLQGTIDFTVDAADRSIQMRLIHFLPFKDREDIIHIAFSFVAFDNLGCLVDQQHPGNPVEFDALVDNHPVLDTVLLQKTDVDRRHSAGIVAE